MNADLQEQYVLSKLGKYWDTNKLQYVNDAYVEQFDDPVKRVEFQERYWDLFDVFLSNKFPNLDDDIINYVDRYYEFPDLSTTYTFGEIISTFNSVTESGKLFYEIQQNKPKRYHLTEKSYGHVCGNVIDIDTFNKCELFYVHENDKTNEYLIYARNSRIDSIILLHEKIDLDQLCKS